MVVPDTSQEGNAFLHIIDPACPAQIARLFDQDKLLIETAGGLFAERTEAEMSGIFDVLDVACTPGEWVLEVAQAYPEIEVVGIDANKAVIQYARAHARVRRLTNAHFHVMDILQPLKIPDESFDLVNICPIIGSIPPAYCLQFLAECMRVLRPGGIMRLTDGDWGSSNALAFETLSGIGIQARQKAGQTFSPTGRTTGPLQMMTHLLRKAGFQNVGYKPYILDFSFGSPMYEQMARNYSIAFKLVEPFLLKMQLITQEDFDHLYDRALLEMLSDDFCAAWTMLTTWGGKPQESSVSDPLT